MVKVKLPTGTKPTFAEAWATYGDCIVTTSKHVAALQDGALHDIWDGRVYDYGDIAGERKAQSVWIPKSTEGVSS